MSEGFDFYNIGKRMPYTTPDGFLDGMEDKVLERIQKEENLNSGADIVPDEDKASPRKPGKMRLLMGAAVAMAACTALFVAVNVITRNQNDDGLEDIENAFCQLSTDDQTYLLDTYQDDLFFYE